MTVGVPCSDARTREHVLLMRAARTSGRAQLRALTYDATTTASCVAPMD